MPFDRVATLRGAEKLLRQGKLDAAIVEYGRVVEDQSSDWNTANLLGDLYVRAGRVDKAIEQFIRIADHLHQEGFLPRAGAVYKKILKLTPDHEHALVQAAEIAANQGLLADARTYLGAVAERRRVRGNAGGVAQIRIRLGALDPNDFEARVDAARARAEIGDGVGALRDLKEVAGELTARSREADAIEVLREAAVINPHDEDLRERLLHIYLRSGDVARARQCAASKAQHQMIAAELEARGEVDQAIEVLREAAGLDPGDLALRARLGRALVARGDVEAAAEYLTSDAIGDDPELRRTVAELQIRAGRVDEGVAMLRRLIEEHSLGREPIAVFGWTLAEQDPDAGLRVVELAAESAVAQGDWAGAAATLQAFVTRVPNHVGALMRLVEICVDGSLEAMMFSAQAQLADAYLAAGQAAEARVIAEDLVAREPWERANIDRFRRALVMLGDADPDAVIADRLSGQSPFVSTDLSLAELASEASRTPGGGEVAPGAAVPPTADERVSGAEAVSAPVRAGPATVGRHFELGPNAIDVGQLLSEAAGPAVAPTAVPEEVDLSVALADIRREAASQAGRVAPVEAKDLDGVFRRLRDDASRVRSADTGEADYRRGLALYEAGHIDEASEALRAAARSAQVRFSASWLLGRLYRERNDPPRAIEWFERAAQAPPPTADEGHRLLYELAELLEMIGETARALAICLELQANAGDYRDVSGRIERLAKVEARG